MLGDSVFRKKIDPPFWRRWPETEKILLAFDEAGGMVWFVGGCVRDAILGVESGDIDICTDLHPKAVMRILGDADIKVVPTGLNHGTVTAIENKRHFEITTLRQDIRSHGRHADVAFTNDLKEDAARRDFTFNAMYLTPHGDLIDPYDGVSDLRSGRVRFIGSAEDRIREDRLRVLRFFRFFARFGKMPPDQDALDACMSARAELTQLSAERISKEVMLLLQTADPIPSLRLMRETGVLSEVLGPKVTLELLAALVELPVPSDELVKFASLFDANSADVVSAALQLRMSTKSKDRLTKMCRQDLPADFSKQDLAAALYKHGALAISDQIILLRARGASSEQLASTLGYVKDWREPVFPIKGSDLLALGASPGPGLGKTLERLEEAWIASGFEATKADLLDSYKSQAS